MLISLLWIILLRWVVAVMVWLTLVLFAVLFGFSKYNISLHPQTLIICLSVCTAFFLGGSFYFGPSRFISLSVYFPVFILHYSGVPILLAPSVVQLFRVRLSRLLVSIHLLTIRKYRV